MKQVEINYLNMTDAAIAGLNADKEAWQDKVKITETVNAITAGRSEIAGLSFDQQSSKTNGRTDTLHTEMDNMLKLAFNVIQNIRPFARITDNKTLLADTDYSESELKNSKQNEFLDRCKVIYNNGVNYLSQMDGYDLTQDKLDALESSINGFALLSGQRDAIIGVRKTATEAIPVIIERLRKQFMILDDLVPALIKDERIVQTYKNNRRIIDR